MTCGHAPLDPGRRRLLRLAAGAPLVLGLPLAGCGGGDQAGPVQVSWDRDTCELCRMIIGDARFAAQVRGGERRRAFKFDDIGCAVTWLNGQGWAAAAETEIWVAAFASTRGAMDWLAARAAHYGGGVHSPMNYNFAAFADPAPGRVPFDQVTARVLAGGPNHVCPAHPRGTPA
ncbi:MAG: nitrous oxide reductase accessory protein NosL [Hyphomicrobiales bacterium]|nr:nitrous oxide reductase accessory protein NosL [Hyphomicrobiales bacterium]MCP5371188.1 nitrous oxide reductase accessory protein NosL [Hyphomicrobiales bacterium]